ncbi:hypothetical protein EDB85DRAFT_1917562 [Lactarius pseudohatsudake]|nr:hypothetical protein EDB85DRAFT_1917562 [Lactarius pseudohatsudake]
MRILTRPFNNTLRHPLKSILSSYLLPLLWLLILVRLFSRLAIRVVGQKPCVEKIIDFNGFGYFRASLSPCLR